ncbi:hypothetical protein [Pseudomonas putida]|nr:hypothetical protein [Pseudomonas putida]MCL8305561.1 hypothetical protein [Pseudomonas putida]
MRTAWKLAHTKAIAILGYTQCLFLPDHRKTGPRQTATIRMPIDVAAMAEFLRQCWFLLLSLYQTIQSHGLVGCVVAFILAILLSKVGSWLTGRAERFTGTVQNGYGDQHHHPAIEGTAKSWARRLVGTLVQIAAGILFLVAMIATANVLLYGHS